MILTDEHAHRIADLSIWYWDAVAELTEARDAPMSCTEKSQARIRQLDADVWVLATELGEVIREWKDQQALRGSP